MEITKYYEMQSKLDQNIIEKKNLDPTKPEFMRKRIIAFKQEFGELLQRLPEVFKDWSNKKNILDDETLEEWVDGFHFLLSIGNWKGWSSQYKQPFVKDLDNYTLDGLTNRIYNCTFSSYDKYELCFDMYFSFIYKLGFSDEQIAASYMKKNAVNFERQEQGY